MTAPPPHVTVRVPGSKSIANRALICAALAEGTSVVRNAPNGDDTEAMLGALRTLGHQVVRSGPDVSLTRRVPSPHPAGEHLTLDAGLAGTTSRFLTAVAAVDGRPIAIDGGLPLRARPMGPLHDALAALGAVVDTAGAPGHLPVTVTGGTLDGGTVRLPGDVSSQFISALMLIGPVLTDGVRIELTTPLVSRPYVAITASVMGAFGAARVDIAEQVITVAGGGYRATDYVVEPDASSASYPWAAAAITGSSVCVAGMRRNALQGDVAILDILESMGCTVTSDGAGVTVTGTGALHGVTVVMTDVSDLVPTVAAAALFATTATSIGGVGFIRAKESDRLGDLAAELRLLGADVAVEANGLRIAPSGLHGAAVATHHDHRLAMAFGIIGLVVDGISIDDPSVVTKSWPDYWAMVDQLRRAGCGR